MKHTDACSFSGTGLPVPAKKRKKIPNPMNRTQEANKHMFKHRTVLEDRRATLAAPFAFGHTNQQDEAKSWTTRVWVGKCLYLLSQDCLNSLRCGNLRHFHRLCVALEKKRGPRAAGFDMAQGMPRLCLRFSQPWNTQTVWRRSQEKNNKTFSRPGFGR